MKIYIVPMRVMGFTQHNVAVRLRGEETPVLYMRDIQVTLDGYRNAERYASQNASFSILGTMVDGVDLKDNDVLLIQMKNNPLSESMEVELVCENGLCLSENTIFTPIGLAMKMEKGLCVCIGDIKHRNLISTAVQIFNKTAELYRSFPAFMDIMVKDEENETKEVSLLELILMQDDDFIRWAETMLLSMDTKYKTLFPVAKQILEKSTTNKGFTLLSKEEQVAAFLEFSKRHASKAVEFVPDELIDYLKESPEYGLSLDKLKTAGLGNSATQQFNVLQQVGFFGGRMDKGDKGSVIYNLSDMGAGKTLMTVQAIFVIDCIKIGVWNRMEKNPYVEVGSIFLPDKHIIAPALSVKASWVDTFRLFYDVEKITDYHYELTAEFDGLKAKSQLYLAPFTTRSGKVFVQEKLPEPFGYDTYLIVDEIHQLVRRRISRTKFFVPGITPVDKYNIFALSGTMSNLKSGEWLSLIRFLGDISILESVTEAKKLIAKLDGTYKEDIGEVAENLEILQHRKFNVDDIVMADRYLPTIKNKSVIEQQYLMRYGSKLLVPAFLGDSMKVQDVLSGKQYHIEVEPEENDNISFELFYRIAATSAITAQSLQVAEELFGEQATQHKSSIIKTLSPFTDEEILLLDTLHKIAADANKYRSPNIGRDINNAILNLNDGLQPKDLYTLIAGFAERNTKFLEYLAGLDVNVLERLPKTSLIKSPNLTDTHKFHVLKELLEKDKDETFLIVVNDFYAMKSLAEALGVEYLSKQELKDEMAYQELLDGLFEKQDIVIVTQDMIKSSLDLVQANRLVQYQLNTEVSDIIQTQNRINRIGQTRETKCYYIAADRLQNALIELFLESYRNIRVAHKGIVELFADLSSQIDVINDYLDVAFKKLGEEGDAGNEGLEEIHENTGVIEENGTDLTEPVVIPRGYYIQRNGSICNAILFPEKTGVGVIVPLRNGSPYRLGRLKDGILGPIIAPIRAQWNLDEMKLVV